MKHSYIHIPANIQFFRLILQYSGSTVHSHHDANVSLMPLCLWVRSWVYGYILWCVSESNALQLLTCFSGIYVIQLPYGANFILPREISLFFDSQHIVLRPYRDMFSDIWRGTAGNIKKMKQECQNTENSMSVCLFLSVSRGPLFSSYPQTHLSDWEDFSCTDSLLSPSACSQAKVKH